MCRKFLVYGNEYNIILHTQETKHYNMETFFTLISVI